MRTWLRALALLCCVVAGAAHAAPLVAISGDEGDDASGSNAADSLLFDETSSTDTAIGLSTEVVHGADNGGPPANTSKRAIRVNVSSGQHAAYDLKAGILRPNLTTLGVAIAVHVPVAGQVTVAKPIVCITEASRTDYGCCIVEEPAVGSLAYFSAAYLGSDEGACTVDANCDADEKCYGTVCRKVWATTSLGITEKRCSNAPEQGCTTLADCPAVTCSCTTPSCGGTCSNNPSTVCDEHADCATCDGANMPKLTIGQTNSTTRIVRCDFYRSGTPVSVGVTKELSATGEAGGNPVHAINSNGTAANRSGLRVGFLNSGSLSSAGKIYLDSIVLDTSIAPGPHYVAGVKPFSMLDCLSTGSPCKHQWVEHNCRTGDFEACLNDWAVSPYLYDDVAGASSDNNSLRSTGANKEQDLPQFGPQGWTIRAKETVTAVDLYAFGRKGSFDSKLRLSTLSCPSEAGAGGCEATEKKACSGDKDYACATTAECQAINGAWTCDPHEVTLSSTDHVFLLHHLTTASPSTEQSSWQAEYGAVGARLNSGSTISNRNVYIGALQANIAVRTPDVVSPPTLTDRSGDGKRCAAAIGASTLYGTGELTCQGGLYGAQGLYVPCSRDFYCGYDSVAQDIGCVLDSDCYVCSLEHGLGCGNAGVPDDALCNFGGCTNGMCDTDDDRNCNNASDCDRGPCLGATAGDGGQCVDACPPDPATLQEGVCPTARAGWFTPVVDNFPLDVALVCACPGETSAQAFDNRFDKIVRGRAIGVPDEEVIGSGFPGADGQVIQTPGTNASLCVAAVGTGVCECTDATVADDCGGSAPTCIGEGGEGLPPGVGICSGSASPTRLACMRGSDCRQAYGRACKFCDTMDEIAWGMSLNDTVLMFSEQYAPFYRGLDPECATRSGEISGFGGGAGVTDKPVLWCPRIGTGAYEVPATACLGDDTCAAGVAYDSTCYGQCTDGQGFCTKSAECTNSARCSLDAAVCDEGAECPSGVCVGGNPGYPGITMGGRCACLDDGDCNPDYLCAGPDAGPKFCRARCGCTANSECGARCLPKRCSNNGAACTTAADCPAGTNVSCLDDCSGGTCTGGSLPSTYGRCTTGSKSGTCTGAPDGTCTSGPLFDGSTMACNTSYCDVGSHCDNGDALHKLVEGRCTATCSAVDCDSDEDCRGAILDQRWEHERQLLIQGICNPAPHRCSGCGTVNCSDHQALLDRGCSCTTDVQCGAGGDCDPVKGECIAGSRAVCRLDPECATGQRCLRPTTQLRRYEEATHGLLRQVADKAWAKVKADFDYGPCTGGVCAKLPSRACTAGVYPDQCDDSPGITLTAIPMPNGITIAGTYPDLACWQRRPGAAWNDRAHYAMTYHDLYGGRTPNHRIVLPTAYNALRFSEFLELVDQAHTTAFGADQAGAPVLTAWETFDTCLDSTTGVPVKFCQRGDETYASHCTCTGTTEVSDCGTGGKCSTTGATVGICIKGTTATCTLASQCNEGGGRTCTAETFCTASAGCAVGEQCNLRKCLQNEANCPGVSTVCGPD